LFLLNALVGHCGGIARRDYGTGLMLFFSACAMARCALLFARTKNLQHN